MNDHSERQLQSNIKRVLDQQADALREDASLQRDLAAARQRALAASPRYNMLGLTGWGGAIAASLVVALLLLPAENADVALDPLLLELDSELVMDLDSYGLDAEFYEWAVDEVESAS